MFRHQGMFKLLTMYYRGVKGFFLVLIGNGHHIFGRIWTLYSSSPCAHSYKTLIRSRKTLLSYLSKNLSFIYEIFQLAIIAVFTCTYKYWGELRIYTNPASCEQSATTDSCHSCKLILFCIEDLVPFQIKFKCTFFLVHFNLS